MLMDGSSKHSNKPFSKAPMDASGCTKRIIEKWVIVTKWCWCQINEHKSYIDTKIQCLDF